MGELGPAYQRDVGSEVVEEPCCRRGDSPAPASTARSMLVDSLQRPAQETVRVENARSGTDRSQRRAPAVPAMRCRLLELASPQLLAGTSAAVSHGASWPRGGHEPVAERALELLGAGSSRVDRHARSKAGTRRWSQPALRLRSPRRRAGSEIREAAQQAESACHRVIPGKATVRVRPIL
jgi:hypothetical protein